MRSLATCKEISGNQSTLLTSNIEKKNLFNVCNCYNGTFKKLNPMNWLSNYRYNRCS